MMKKYLKLNALQKNYFSLVFSTLKVKNTSFKAKLWSLKNKVTVDLIFVLTSFVNIP